MSQRERYPLSWPEGWKRTTNRENARFGKEMSKQVGDSFRSQKSKLSIEDAFDRIEKELKAFGVDTSSVIVSTNLKLNIRGIPAGNAGEPGDPGAAVYWQRKGKAQCMAIAATLYAMRAIERHGGAQILERAFIGFAALPASTMRPWRDIFGFGHSTPTAAMIEERYRELAKVRHPDKGGSAEMFTELTKAREQALQEV